MRRHLRAVTVAGILVVAAFVLAACQQPLPRITVQTGSFSTTIRPSTYCFDRTQCRTGTRVDLPVVTAEPDATVLVDVPRAVANTGWAVQALSLDGKKSLGGSTVLRGTHTYRIAANANALDPFIVRVVQVRDVTPDGSAWSLLVRVSQT